MSRYRLSAREVGAGVHLFAIKRNRIEYANDAMRNGQTVDTYDPSSTLKRAVTTGYDLRNRIDTINQGGFATDLVFDALGNLTDETDPNSAASGHNYDPLNPNDGAGVHLFAYHIDSLKKLPLAPVEPRASHRFSRFTDRGGLDEPPRQ